MLDDVVQRLLGDPKQRDRRSRGKTRFGLLAVDRDGEPAAVGQPPSVLAEGRQQPELIEAGRAQLEHHVAQPLRGLLKQRLGVIEPLRECRLQRFGEQAAQNRQVQADRADVLGDRVVQLSREGIALGLLDLEYLTREALQTLELAVQGLLGGLALADVDADADQIVLPSVVQALSGEQVGNGAAGFGHKRRLDGVLPVREHALDPRLQQLLVPGVEEIERVHVLDLLCAVAAHLREVAVPAAEPSRTVVKIDNPGHALHDRVGEALLAAQRLHGLYLFGDVAEAADVVRDALCGVAYRRDAQPADDLPAVVPTIDDVARPAAERVQLAPHGPKILLAVPAGGEQRRVAPHDILPAVAEEPLERIVDDLDAVVRIRHHDRGNAVFERALQDRELAVLQRAFENSVAAVMVTDADNRIEVVNDAFERLFGYRREDVVGRDPALLASGRHGEEYFRAMWSELHALGRWSGDIVNRGHDGRQIVCWLSIAAVRDAAQRVTHYIGSFRDITEQIQSMEALRREQRFANAIMESMPGIVYFYDRAGRFRRWNRNFAQVSGYSAEQIEHMHPLDFFDAGHKQLLQARIESVFTNGQDSVEAPLMTKSGRAVPYLFTGQRLHYAGEDYLIGVGIDISKRKAAEQALDRQLERLQSLSRQVLEIQETERNALARELHDSVAQDIGAVGLNLTILRRLLPEPLEAALAQRLDDSQALLEQAAQRLRNVMLELRPPGLDEFGLLAALGEHARRLAHRSGFAVTIDGEEPEPRFAPATAIALFRIAQEALNNIVKHARATQVLIRLSAAGDRMLLEVSDDGIGFDPAARAGRITCGMGMLTMAERAESIGGCCTVEATPGGGTRVTASAPRPALPGSD